MTKFDTVQRAKSGLGEPLNGTSLEGKGGKAHSILSSHLASHGRKNSITGVTKRHPSMPLMSCTGACSAPARSGAELWHDQGAFLSRSKTSRHLQHRCHVFIKRPHVPDIGEVLLCLVSIALKSYRVQSMCYVSVSWPQALVCCFVTLAQAWVLMCLANTRADVACVHRCWGGSQGRQWRWRKGALRPCQVPRCTPAAVGQVCR